MCCPHKPTASLRNGKAFRLVYQEGRHVANPLFVVYARKQETPAPARLGLSVSKKVGNAVKRNLLRRLIKENCRLRILPDGYDYVVVARQGAGDMPRTSAYAQVDKTLSSLFKRLAPASPPIANHTGQNA